MPNRAQEVLYESEAALRLVDHELQELHDIPPGEGGDARDGFDRERHDEIVSKANTEIMAALVRLRERNAQQPLAETADLLHEMERRMVTVARLLDSSRDSK